MIDHWTFVLLVGVAWVASFNANFELIKTGMTSLSIVGIGILVFGTIGTTGMFLDVENYITATGNHWLMAVVLSTYLPYLFFTAAAPSKFFRSSRVTFGRWLFVFSFLSFLIHSIFTVVGSITYFAPPYYPEIFIWVGYGVSLLLWIGYFAVVLLKNPPKSAKQRE